MVGTELILLVELYCSGVEIVGEEGAPSDEVWLQCPDDTGAVYWDGEESQVPVLDLLIYQGRAWSSAGRSDTPLDSLGVEGDVQSRHVGRITTVWPGEGIPGRDLGDTDI